MDDGNQEYSLGMACGFCEELLTRWKLLHIFERDKKVVADAYGTVIAHRTSCEVCKDERIAEALNRKQTLK